MNCLMYCIIHTIIELKLFKQTLKKSIIYEFAFGYISSVENTILFIFYSILGNARKVFYVKESPCSAKVKIYIYYRTLVRVLLVKKFEAVSNLEVK